MAEGGVGGWVKLMREGLVMDRERTGCERRGKGMTVGLTLSSSWWECWSLWHSWGDRRQWSRCGRRVCDGGDRRTAGGPSGL